MSTLEIPFDIVCAVFERLAQLEDIPTLECCALVHPLWHGETRKYDLAHIRPVDSKSDGLNYKLWKGHLLSASSHPLHLRHISIPLLKPTDLEGMATALTSLPYLRHVVVHISDISHLDKPSSPLPLSLDSVTFKGQRSPQVPSALVNLSRFFSRARSIIIDCVPADYRPATDYDTGITPTSVTILADTTSNLLFWCLLLSQPSSAPAVRHIRFAFREFINLHHGGGHRLLRALVNLESVEFDFYRKLKDRAYTPIGTQCRLIKEKFGPVFPSSLHTLCLRLPARRWDESTFWAACLAVLRAVPATLRHVQVRVFDENRNFGVVPFAECLRRFSDLQTLEVILDERKVMFEDPESIAEYRVFLQNGFPDLAARGVLRLTQEVRSCFEY